MLRFTWASLLGALGLTSNTDKLGESSVSVKEEESSSTHKTVKSAVPSSIHTYKKGLYTVWVHVPAWADSIPGSSIWRDLDNIRSTLPFLSRLLRELWSLGPLLCTTYIVVCMLQNVLPSMKLAQTARILSLLEKAIVTKKVDRNAFYVAVILQVFLSTLEWAVNATRKRSEPTLKRRFKYHYNQKLMAVQLKMDLPTSEDEEVKAKLEAAGGQGGAGAWAAFDRLVSLVGTALQLTSASGYVVGSIIKQPGGRTVAVLCFLSPVMNAFQLQQWLTIFYACITNDYYTRTKTLRSFATDSQFKLEFITNGTGDYVKQEYKVAREALGDTPHDVPLPWKEEDSFSFFGLARALIGDSALIFLALKMVTNPEEISLTSIAVMQQTSWAIEYMTWSLMGNGPSIGETFMRVKALYEIDQIINKIQDGTDSYPPESSKGKAMKVEFRNVIFRYPKSESKDNVIDNLSFVIPAGSICVIVGENGCGKSSTLKLLTRTYDVSGGEILIDDKPIQSYKLNELRDASAIMHQEYMHFKLSIRENIGIGNVTAMNDLDAIKQAAKLGGADEFIEKLPSGYDTVMGVEPSSYSSGTAPEGSALSLMLKEKKKAPEAFSGGQTQRLALSRTFMRSMRDCVKLLAYDEPSAALDPKAEFALFERLRGLKGNKTMLFITHRFGYLTKHADQIIYMDKGKAVEMGSHEELVALNGKYAHMYSVQAKAFLD